MYPRCRVWIGLRCCVQNPDEVIALTVDRHGGIAQLGEQQTEVKMMVFPSILEVPGSIPGAPIFCCWIYSVLFDA